MRTYPYATTTSRQHLAAATSLALAVATVDVATKLLAERRLDAPVSLIPGLKLELGHNSGIAFGAFTNAPSWLLVGFVALLVAALAIAVWRGYLRLPWPATGLLLGGAAGNLVDRLADGRVTDFVELPSWPTFNLADIAITFAVLLMLWRGARPERP